MTRKKVSKKKRPGLIKTETPEYKGKWRADRVSEERRETMQDLAHRLGEDPGVQTILEISLLSKELEEARECMRVGQPIPGTAGVASSQIIIKALEKEISERRLKILPYFYPQLRSVDANLKSDGLVVQLMKFGDADDDQTTK